ncbi:hypothetical protein B0H13DRAFT_1869861 [Mycena leptocephala]|nr:hypothetical protein B0H13DRAFT_1869861 [Mycena leptocephala]
MPNEDLSATSEEEDLTPAAKARRTRAKNLAIEEEENKKRAKETANGRETKKTALKNKVWDTSKSNLDASNGRKRAASSATTDQRPKKTKSKGPQEAELVVNNSRVSGEVTAVTRIFELDLGGLSPISSAFDPDKLVCWDEETFAGQNQSFDLVHRSTSPCKNPKDSSNLHKSLGYRGHYCKISQFTQHERAGFSG